jgi:hypothetical protein
MSTRNLLILLISTFILNCNSHDSIKIRSWGPRFIDDSYKISLDTVGIYKWRDPFFKRLYFLDSILEKHINEINAGYQIGDFKIKGVKNLEIYSDSVDYIVKIVSATISDDTNAYIYYLIGTGIIKLDFGLGVPIYLLNEQVIENRKLMSKISFGPLIEYISEEELKIYYNDIDNSGIKIIEVPSE